MENKTTGILVALALILSGTAGVVLTPDTAYYQCESKGMISDCINGVKAEGLRCYWNQTNSMKYEYCSEGWKVYGTSVLQEANNKIPVEVCVKQGNNTACIGLE